MAEENVRMAGLEGTVEVKIKNVYEGINESDLDLITLDLPHPDRVLSHAESSLKPGGFLAAFSPYIERVQRLYAKLPQYGFRNYRTIESLVRDFEVGHGCTRPTTRMIAHTGYLTFARLA